MAVFDDLQAEEERLERILDGLDDSSWLRPSAAPGWSVADVVLHLAQTEELVAESARSDRPTLRPGHETRRDLDAEAEALVRAQAAPPEEVFERWQRARREALTALRRADPGTAMPWVTSPLRPTTLATTRLAEHWAHGLDITGPLGIPFPDTDRLRHVAWLGHRSLPYAFALVDETAPDLRCELVGPSGEAWSFGEALAPSRVTGPAGEFCRIGAQRMTVGESTLVASGPSGARALQLLRNYAA